jgi:type I restriction enzyme, S subunit
MQRLTAKTEFPSYKILYPPEALVIKFNELACTLWEKVHINQKHNQDLVSIRDALLPKLLSGEIYIKNVKKVLEVVA